MFKKSTIMKKFLIAVSVILFTTYVHGQARLGASVSEIKEEFHDEKFTSGNDSDGDFYLAAEFERANVVYYFRNKQERCYITIINPKTQGDLNFYVEMYNKQYTIISPTEWRMYSANGYANVELKFNEEYTYFIWTD
jgi:hypothetical protein